MRVIAGAFRSRTLQAPRGMATRPTSDRLRETLFNVLAPRMAGAHFLDLYAGSGAVGIEALSRGAAAVTFVERSAAAMKVLRGNLKSLGIEGNADTVQSSVVSFLREPRNAAPVHLVFLDPPYDAVNEYADTFRLLNEAARGLLAPAAMIIAEHRRKEHLSDAYGGLRRTRLLEQGDAALSFYAMAEASPEEVNGDS